MAEKSTLISFEQTSPGAFFFRCGQMVTSLLIPFSSISYVSKMERKKGSTMYEHTHKSSSREVNYNTFKIFMNNGHIIEVTPVNTDNNMIKITEDSADASHYDDIAKNVYESIIGRLINRPEQS